MLKRHRKLISELRHFPELYEHEIYIGIHRGRGLHNIIAHSCIPANLIIIKQQMRRKDIRLIFYYAVIHSEKAEFLKPALCGKLSVTLVMAYLVSYDHLLKLIIKSVAEKYEPVSEHIDIHSKKILEIRTVYAGIPIRNRTHDTGRHMSITVSARR